jgi:hypothetical protein
MYIIQGRFKMRTFYMRNLITNERTGTVKASTVYAAQIHFETLMPNTQYGSWVLMEEK